MTDEELKLVERNRKLTRNVTAPIMSVVGILGLVGGIWVLSTETSIIGIGLTSSAIVMISLAVYFFISSRKPVVRVDKFYVTGIVTDRKQTGSILTHVYYQVKLNEDKYTGYVTKQDFKKCQPGDIIRCERLDETSVDVYKVENLGKI